MGQLATRRNYGRRADQEHRRLVKRQRAAARFVAKCVACCGTFVGARCLLALVAWLAGGGCQQIARRAGWQRTPPGRPQWIARASRQLGSTSAVGTKGSANGHIRGGVEVGKPRG
jgi:hypothetical protein